MYSKPETVALELAKPIAEENGCFIYDVEFVKEGGIYILRVYIDREDGVDLDVCEVVSRALSEQLDKKDPVKQNYYLEVSSPGIERKLRLPEHFERYMGERIDVGFYKAVNGSKQITAYLEGYDEDEISLKLENEEIIKFNIKETTFIKLHFDF